MSVALEIVLNVFSSVTLFVLLLKGFEIEYEYDNVLFLFYLLLHSGVFILQVTTLFVHVYGVFFDHSKEMLDKVTYYLKCALFFVVPLNALILYTYFIYWSFYNIVSLSIDCGEISQILILFILAHVVFIIFITILAFLIMLVVAAEDKTF